MLPEDSDTKVFEDIKRDLADEAELRLLSSFIEELPKSGSFGAQKECLFACLLFLEKPSIGKFKIKIPKSPTSRASPPRSPPSTHKGTRFLILDP